MTFQQALAHGTAVLAKAGIANAHGDARKLLCHAAGVASDRLTLLLRDPVGAVAEASFSELIAARVAHVPVSHLVGGRQFFGRWFEVTCDVLDPRPETETLVAGALAEPIARVLDLGVGSGAILLSLLAEWQTARGVGVDVSDAAIAVAARNASGLDITPRAVLQAGNWYDGLDEEFDLIVSNPPYIAADEMDDLQPEVRDHEPRIALTDEADGLTHYRHIIANHDPHLMPGGRLMVEIGPTQAAAVKEMMGIAGLTEITVIPDLDGRDRVVWGRKPRKTA
ncbi:[protein release factor]-glutamine N5-methyltransferase [Cognatiyoonia koreensis]|uniref:Release factor glutamine methyltransferase n=1 Tax=Cognatiyoonia koreensis TaxID=364200 RepID=A0A1I0NYR6_9RHOB|nr:peptide chain release factor N(5)-glutamine methyltransferase [Cognatiyoonia koreensis]SEW06695.1 [protein release factor]-glutamine N5-methyltransferase [Cognatiyoonia koreensis]